jgi:cell wall-associated NlpC family hydrolase
MGYAVITVTAAPVRKKPSHRREMVNQLLFGEAVEILREKDLWVKVKSLHDQYEGWMSSSQLEKIRMVPSRQINTTTTFLSQADWADKKVLVPAGASLPELQNGKGKFLDRDFLFKEKSFKPESADHSLEKLKDLTMPWLDIPYLWGGRTALGIDCSGFVQVIFKMMGINMPRDAWQQAQEGTPVKKLKYAQPGDLAFFDNKEDIVHVGILLGNETIIHSSGKVRIDGINKQGIVFRDGTKRKIKLRAIRRVFNNEELKMEIDAGEFK